MKRHSVARHLALVVLAVAVVWTPAAADDIEIPFETFVLDNGLTVLVHEDDKAPIVAVNVWYHVGSKNEKDGKTGFAHLFEHLMFNGSENFDDDYFQAAERMGATDLNGTTNEDRTNYFQNVPTSALDRILWLESDRMGHLLGAVTQEKLDEQRGVVQNEKRQFENQPYSAGYELTVTSTWPAHHPYSHTVIGSMEDLDAAALEDVHEWFKTYYGPSNAVLVLAGDIDLETAREKVEKYFGDIPPGPPVAHHQDWVAKRTGAQRQRVQDRVPQARISKVWNIPSWGSADADLLTLAARILGSGKTSRLYKRLVYDDQIATGVNVEIDDREIAGQFVVEATAKPGADLASVEAALDEEMNRFLADGPTADEVRRVATRYRADFVRGIERIGGFGGKSDILAMGQVYRGDPDHYKKTLRRVAAASPEEVHAAARAWLSDGVYVLEVHPFPELASKAEGADRAAMPGLADPPKPAFPVMRRATLSNGLEIVLARRSGVPLVNMNLMVDAGYAADVSGQPGTASLAMNMMDEGTTSRTALEISDELAGLGSYLGTGSDLDVSSVRLSTLNSMLDKSLDVFVDVVLHPSFPEAELQRLKQRQLAQIQAEKAAPIPMALRVLPKLMYGEGHAYSQPFTGSGTEESLASIGRDDLVEFHRTWFAPNNATLVVAGDVSMDELRPKLEARFKEWKKRDVPSKNLATVAGAEKPVVYLMDRPGSIQSLILGGHVVVPKANPDEVAIQAMNQVLGGSFTARLNMNLREDKHWSYGAGSLIIDARGQRPFLMYAPVQADKTKESLAELIAELKGILGGSPVQDEELVKVKNNQVLQLPGSWETNDEVLGAMMEMVQYGYPEDYWDRYPEKVTGLDLAAVQGAAKSVLRPGSVVWLVVGDRAKIEAGLRDLGLENIRPIDPDGNPI